MLKTLKKDFEINSSIVSKIIILIYRFGNHVYYKINVKLIKIPLWLIYKIIDFIFRFFSHCEIPAKTQIGHTLRIEHSGYGVVIHPDAIIGNNCHIFHQVTVGVDYFSKGDSHGTAIIGNNAYIGCGAKIIGKVIIGDNVRIGANAVVISDVPSDKTAVGVPAKIK